MNLETLAARIRGMSTSDKLRFAADLLDVATSDKRDGLLRVVEYATKSAWFDTTRRMDELAQEEERNG